MMSNFFQIIHPWQSLVGAFLGVLLPILFYLLREWFSKRKKHREHLLYLEKVFLIHLNSVVEARNTMVIFLNEQLSETIKDIDNSDKKNIYAANTAFFPNFYTNLIPEFAVESTSKSAFIDGEITLSFLMAQNFSQSVEDARRQFKDTIDKNTSFALGKINPPLSHNNFFRNNLKKYSRNTQKQLVDTNVEVLLKQTAKVISAIRLMAHKGLWGWKFFFEPRFRFFWSCKKRKEAQTKTVRERIEQEISEEEKSILAQAYQNFKDKND